MTSLKIENPIGNARQGLYHHVILYTRAIVHTRVNQGLLKKSPVRIFRRTQESFDDFFIFLFQFVLTIAFFNGDSFLPFQI